MPLFSIPLSGLNASSNALSVVADNLANLNTVGFKEQRANFRDLFYQTVGTTGAGEPMQIGAGAAVAEVASNFTDGSLETTGVSTNAAITGDGFFVVEQPSGKQTYTRGGNFTVNTAGELSTEDGGKVLGYPAVNGVISTATAIGPISLGKGQISPAKTTESMRMSVNLNANANVGDSLTSPVSVFDSLGNSHELSVVYTKTGTNTWSYTVSIPGADVGQSAAQQVASGNLVFDSNGQLQSPTSAQTIAVTGLADGASNLSIQWNLLDANGNPTISQVAGKSGTASTYQDGYTSGSLLDFSIGPDGTIEGSFSNGQNLALGQLVLATFANNNGLSREGENEFQATQSSGLPVIGAPGSSGRGSITGGALELSNVDIATEFSRMIITQRGYSANARVVTTFDEVTQDTINMKR